VSSKQIQAALHEDEVAICEWGGEVIQPGENLSATGQTNSSAVAHYVDRQLRSRQPTRESDFVGARSEVGECIGAFAARQDKGIVTLSTRDAIVAESTAQAIVAIVTKQDIIACVAKQRVIPIVAIEAIADCRAVEAIVVVATTPVASHRDRKGGWGCEAAITDVDGNDGGAKLVVGGSEGEGAVGARNSA
jgi:hypothetical protein